MNAKTATQAYASVEIESGVHAADPHKLIAMLFQGALLAIANARNAIQRKDIATKGSSITKAIMIIGEGLQSSLDKNVGGELAQNLDALYSYMCTRLLIANANDDLVALDEVARLLGELKGAWDSIRPTVMAQAQPAQLKTPTQNKKPELVYGRM